jgi:hypothetical protein
VDKVEQNLTSTFSSQHLYLVGFLVCAGHGITDLVRNGRCVSFEFSQTPELLTDVAGFMSGALIPARHYIRQQRTRKGGIAPTAKTDAGFRDEDAHPLVAKMLRVCIGNRKTGFLLETDTGNMLWPAPFTGTVSRPSLKIWAGERFGSTPSLDSDKPGLKRAKCGNF